MTSIQERNIKPRLEFLELAKQLGSVSQAFKVIYSSQLRQQLISLEVSIMWGYMWG
ncbi:hypothetical protein [Ruegeria profundi]|uniref:hypothetical protein n=1 Tax=Ruegeria profundi TaxID=1685378 RepID=UPI001CD75EBE|nr:hypothetical protein [Ruegeria profundi]MCA0930166.1 hypothetical protein [Ruegeria profundi]